MKNKINFKILTISIIIGLILSFLFYEFIGYSKIEDICKHDSSKVYEGNNTESHNYSKEVDKNFCGMVKGAMYLITITIFIFSSVIFYKLLDILLKKKFKEYD